MSDLSKMSDEELANNLRRFRDQGSCDEAARRLTAAAERIERLMFQHANQRTTLENYEAALRRAGLDPCDFSKAVDKIAAERNRLTKLIQRAADAANTARMRLLDHRHVGEALAMIGGLYDAALSPAPAVGATKVSVTITEKSSGGICVDLSPNPSMLPDGDVKTTAQKIEKALASWGLINTIRTGYSATALRLAGQEEPAPTPAPAVGDKETA